MALGLVSSVKDIAGGLQGFYHANSEGSKIQACPNGEYVRLTRVKKEGYVLIPSRKGIR